MSRCRFVLMLGMLLGVGPQLASVAAGEPFRYPEGSHGTGELRYINGLPVLTVAGTPEQIGEAVGVLALKPAQRMLDYPEDLLKFVHMRALWHPAVSQGNKMLQQFPTDYQQELEAIVRGAGVDHDSVVLGNTLFDIKKWVACSALLLEANRSATGGPLMGRNLDLPSMGYAHEYSLVTVYRPCHARHAFASVGFPGLVGCLSGINDAGLAVAVLEVFQVKVGVKKCDLGGVPFALCYRRLLEECATIDEAKSLLEMMRRTGATNLVVADPNGVAVFEVTPEGVHVRRPQQGVCVCSNHFCSEGYKPVFQLNLFRTQERYQVLEQAPVGHERLTVQELRHDLDLAWGVIEALQTMIFEPATLRAHLAIGSCPASTAELRTLELAPLLQRP